MQEYRHVFTCSDCPDLKDDIGRTIKRACVVSMGYYCDEGGDSFEPARNKGEPVPTRDDPTKRTWCPIDYSVGDPVNVATGNKYENVLDLKISTPGIPLEFRRFYNSQGSSDGSLGYGWTHNHDISLEAFQTNPKKRIRIWDSDGRALYFNQVQQTSTEILFGGESGVKDRLKQVISTGDYFLRRRQGNLTYRFGSDGKLLTISDPNGNTIALTYTGGLLTQVSDNFGKALTIHYTNNHIDSITDPNGRSISYQYTNGDLTQVSYPDQNLERYAYSNHNLLISP
jgi:YD repeat-containing protein